MPKVPSSARQTDTQRRGTSRRLLGTPAAAPVLDLRLYVSTGAPNSRLAIANLEALRSAHFGVDSRVEIVDVFREPERAREDAVMLTPMLVKRGSGKSLRILGTLDDAKAVLAALGLPGP